MRLKPPGRIGIKDILCGRARGQCERCMDGGQVEAGEPAVNHVRNGVIGGQGEHLAGQKAGRIKPETFAHAPPGAVQNYVYLGLGVLMLAGWKARSP